jgi:hypothetical protein
MSTLLEIQCGFAILRSVISLGIMAVERKMLAAALLPDGTKQAVRLSKSAVWRIGDGGLWFESKAGALAHEEQLLSPAASVQVGAADEGEAGALNEEGHHCRSQEGSTSAGDARPPGPDLRSPSLPPEALRMEQLRRSLMTALEAHRRRLGASALSERPREQGDASAVQERLRYLVEHIADRQRRAGSPSPARPSAPRPDDDTMEWLNANSTPRPLFRDVCNGDM